MNVMLVDDHPVVLAGFERLLGLEASMSVVATATSAAEVLPRLKKGDVDIVVLDINMPVVDGIQLCRQVVAKHSRIKVVILSTHEGEPFVGRSFNAGATAYLSKRCAPDELIAALKEVERGGTYISADVARAVAYGGKVEGNTKLDRLTAREYEIFRCFAGGKSPAEVAEDLGISRKTVYVHRENIFKKLDITGHHAIYRLAALEGITG